MKKVALLGEHPSDSNAVKNLFSRRYPETIFEPLIFNIHGSELDNPENTKLKRLIRLNFEAEKPDLLIFIRDLDGFKTDKTKVAFRKNIFSVIRKIVNRKAIFMLNIWELEALILADIEVFNHKYSVQVKIEKSPDKVENPKEILKQATRSKNNKFSESHNPTLFNLLSIEKLSKNHVEFRKLIEKLDKKISPNEIFKK
jgi:hypothetical protein